MRPAILALEDGFVAQGTAFGADGEISGEVVFNTSMTGYQEILTDPSYKGQIVTMTYPLIGNYGVNLEDVESHKIQAEGLIVKELSCVASNYRSRMPLADYLKEGGVVGIQGIDTRQLTRHIRIQGAMKGVLSTTDLDAKRLIKKAKESPGLIGRDLVREVTCQARYEWPLDDKTASANKGRFHVVVLDCGVKFNILRMLSWHDCRVTVVPAASSAESILGLSPDGILLSNGPGDPAALGYIVETVKKLLGKRPIFGICLGHQMLGLAFGGKTFKLKFGHRGANHPVKDLRDGTIAITSQNHGFCVDPLSMPHDKVEVTHLNLNDMTAEGLRHKLYPAFSVQYHPEASPGPHDAANLFREFIDLMSCDHTKPAQSRPQS